MPEDDVVERVGTLESDVGSEVYQELLSAFLEHLSLQRHDLTEAAESGDVATAQSVAHQLKGTATSFGAFRLDELALRVLQMDRDQDVLLRSLVGEIVTEIAELQAGVRI